MRLLTCFLLLAASSLQAKEPNEQDQLAWFNYQLAVAEAPGDAWSDLRMAQMLAFTSRVAAQDPGGASSEAMRAFQARAQVVVAALESRVDETRDSDPFLLAADLGCWPKAEEMPVCDQRRAKLEPFAADNAYHGVLLMAYAWTREDAAAFLRVARLAAAAEDYDSLPALGFRSMVERYRKVPMPATPDMDALTRAYTPEVLAMAMTIGTSLPPYQGFTQPCRESEGELRGHCLAIARKMMLQGQHILEVRIALSLVEALGTADDLALAAARQREMEWLQEKALPLMIASEKVAVAGTEEFFQAYGSDGEIAALRAMLEAHGIAGIAPADWAKAPAPTP